MLTLWLLLLLQLWDTWRRYRLCDVYYDGEAARWV
jgi:hypothetical protein